MTYAELASGLYGKAAVPAEDRTWWCNGDMASPEQYCARVNTVPAYLEVNRYQALLCLEMILLRCCNVQTLPIPAFMLFMLFLLDT
jgi:hypothetical protein